MWCPSATRRARRRLWTGPTLGAGPVHWRGFLPWTGSGGNGSRAGSTTTLEEQPTCAADGDAMRRRLASAFGRLTGRGSADAAAYERAARDAYQSATITDVVPVPAPSPAPERMAIPTPRSTMTPPPRSDDRAEDASPPVPATVSRAAKGGAYIGVAQTAETLEGAIRPWGPKAPSAAPRTFTIDPFRAEAAEAVAAGAAGTVAADAAEAVTPDAPQPVMAPWAEAVVASAPEPVIAASAEAVTAGTWDWVPVMSTVADQEAEADWEGVVDAAARLANRQVGDTAPEFLMRVPPSVGLTAGAFFDGLVQRVESDR